LIMFVTASLLDPAGQPVVPSEDEDPVSPDSSPQSQVTDTASSDILSPSLPQ